MNEFVGLYPFKGFIYFITNPRLWLKPLFIMFLAGISLILTFSFSSWGFWPPHAPISWLYALQILKALGYASLVTIVVWAFLISVLISYLFDSLLRVCLKKEGLLNNELSFVSSFSIGLQVMLRTLGWRIFWPVITLVSVFVFPFASAILGQLGIGHMAVIDSAGITMSFLGFSASKQVGVYKGYRKELFLMGVVAGLGSLVFLPTFIVWLFWFPGIYIGSAFWITKNVEKINA